MGIEFYLSITFLLETDYSSSMLPPKVREAMKLSRPQEFKRLPGRVLQIIL
jgi:hypothetical protein